MDDATRERLERQHRPQLFEDCRQCGEPQVKISTHTCDKVRLATYRAAQEPLPSEPDEYLMKFLEEKLLEVFVRQRIVATSQQLHEVALALEPYTHGPIAMAAGAD
jgi:hypothetical protein